MVGPEFFFQDTSWIRHWGGGQHVSINRCRFVHFDVCLSDHILSRTSLKLQEESTRNFVGRQILLSGSTVHKKYNSALPNLGVIVLFYTLNIVITLKLHKISTRNHVRNSISLSRSAMHTHHHSVLPILFVIALCLFLHFELCRRHSETTSDFIKFCTCTQMDLIEQKCSAQEL